MYKSAALVLLCMLCFTERISSYKILVVVTPPSTSHYTLGKGIADILHERGHEITLIGSIKNEKPTFREIFVPECMEFKNSQAHRVGFQRSDQSVLEGLKFLTEFMPKIPDLVFGSKDVKKLINDKKETFDLVIIEHFFNDALLALGPYYNCPVIAISPISLLSPLAIITGNPLAPEINPDTLQHVTRKMTLMQRVKNVLIIGFQQLLSEFVVNPIHESVYKKHFPELSSKIPLSDFQTNISAVFINSHPSLNAPRPLLPNAIEIAGYHIKDAKPLPSDLQTIMDSAKHGVIYFSMGSVLKSADMSSEAKKIILTVFSKLKQTVLWKFEEDLPGKAANVIIRNWMPQASILAHSNVKFFISHGGFLSKTEATHYGVPLLAIPIFGDQRHNAMGLVERGNGIMLEYTNITENSFSWAINEMLTNPKYGKVAKEAQKTYHDRPMKPKDLVAFYAEHVIRSGGAPHLSPPKLPRISSLLIDVFAILIFVPVAVIASIVFICLKCCRKIKKSKLKQN